VSARLQVIAIVLGLAAIAGCGGAASGTTSTTGAPLGVQSNAPSSHVTLRMRAPGPIAFATSLEVRLDSEMMGQPMNAEFETRGVRRVLEQRADGTLSVEEIDTQSRYAITMMGRTRTGPESAPSSAPEPRRYVLGARGERIEAPGGASRAATPGGGAGGPIEEDVPERLGSVLGPLVRALEFPERAIAPGEAWDAEGRIPLGAMDPELAGDATYRLTQRLERLEGSGDERVAVISFEGSLEGGGRTVAGGTVGGGAPGDDGSLRGSLSFRGFYTVALADGFARVARADFDGLATLGEGEGLSFPLRGRMEWTAAPIAAGVAPPAAPEPGAL
jgi:hypothetical protein